VNGIKFTLHGSLKSMVEFIPSFEN